ncbi:undecaprenyl-phosphate galactose phosphotransferase WbaP, partial [archaeon]|nr:undecaprenyl-phosphate galactose phosphotransferase WbaP [archaeon]
LGMWPLFLLLILMFAYGDLYPSVGMSFWEETKKVLKSTMVAFSAVVIMTFITKTSVNFSRTVVVMSFMISILMLPAMRRAMRSILRIAGLWEKEIVIIGTESAAREVLCNLRKHPDWGYIPAGVVLQKGETAPGGMKLIGCVENIRDLSFRVDEVIVAMPDVSRRKLVNIVESASRFAPVVKVVADLYGLASVGVRTHDLDGMLLLEMEDRLALKKNRVMKRMFDLICSIICLIVLSPIFALLAVLVIIDSRGPVFFGHTRVGRDGKEFICYKFRTMVTNAQQYLEDILKNDSEAKSQWEKDYKLKDDPRITRVGRILRKTSLDELPQIWNVVKGEMSLIGPRPIVADEIERYGQKSKYFFKVTPGITGLWQVSGRNDIDYDERVLLDEYYAKNWSLWLDIEILLRTIGAVLRKSGAY